MQKSYKGIRVKVVDEIYVSKYSYFYGVRFIEP